MPGISTFDFDHHVYQVLIQSIKIMEVVFPQTFWFKSTEN